MSALLVSQLLSGQSGQKQTIFLLLIHCDTHKLYPNNPNDYLPFRRVAAP